MNYNKNSTSRRLNHADSKKTKVKNKAVLIALKIFMVLFIVIGIIGASAASGVARGIIDSAPDITNMDVAPTGFSTTVLSADGKEIATLVASGANRKYVTIDEIPVDLQHAFVAIEDSRFYEHNGIDLQGIVRAGVVGITNGFNFNQGASTITQQLIKNNVLTSWTSETSMIERVQRKIQEQYLALKLEAQMQDKDLILENYLNTINLGANTLGVQAASQKYFGKDVSELTLSECAVIAGITQNPYKYNPITHPDKNAERREKVLNDMLEQEYITQEEHDEALSDNVYERITAHNETTSSATATINSYFVDALIEDVIKDLMEKKGYTETEAYKALYQGGLTIIATQDTRLQTICDEEINNQSNYTYATKYSFDLYFQVKKADGTVKAYTQYTMLNHYRKVTGNNEFSINYASEAACRTAIAEYQKAVLEEGDSIVEGSENILITLQPQAALTLIDQYTGEVKAMVGGRGDKTGNRTWNRATDTTRQPGSSFKMLTCYSAALDTGAMTLASVIDDAPFTVGDKTYKNWDEQFHGLTTIREAVRFSHNITAVKTLDQIGVNLGYQYAQNYGISTLVEEDKHLGLALGGLTHGVTNLELAAAYATIANSGEYIEPSFYTQIYDQSGNLILDNSSNVRRTVIKETTAWLLTDVMADTMITGTADVAYFGNTMAQAGKSGTTTSNRDGVFAGFTPYYTCVVWGGYDDNAKQENVVYTRYLWKAVMKRIHEELPYKNFVKPDGIISAEVCNKSGLLPIEGTCDHDQTGSTVYTEYFELGSLSTKTCNHHVTLDICESSGNLASANCPADQVVQKVFLYDASTETQDAEYIISEEFLNTVCPHKSSPDPASHSEDNENSEDQGETGGFWYNFFHP
jgi:penicillin-binding protein 1A